MKNLYRSQRDKKLFGLCGGLAETLNVDANLLRLILVITAFFSGGAVILLYIVACLVIPKEPALSAYGFDSMHSGQGQSYYQAQRPPFMGRENGYGQQSGADEQPSHIDDMMKDIEKKALLKEIEALRAKVDKYEKGDV